jgi:DNA-binding MarR family transcriptional regulator
MRDGMATNPMTQPTFMDIQREAERELGFMTMTPEYELICCMLDQDWLTPSRFQELARMSPASLRSMLARLVARGVAILRQNPDDHRSTQYQLTDTMREPVLQQYQGYLQLAARRRFQATAGQVPLNNYQSYIHKGRQVSHLTAEFQILLYLYVAAGLGNHEISQFIDVSVAKFNQSLGKLRGWGLVEVTADPADRRSKLYDLAPRVRDELDRLHRRVAKWLNSKGWAAEFDGGSGEIKS